MKKKSLAASIASAALSQSSEVVQEEQKHPEAGAPVHQERAESPKRDRADSGEQKARDDAAKAALIEEEVRNRVQHALQELRDEKQPHIDAQ